MDEREDRRQNRAELRRAFVIPAMIGLVVLGVAGVNFANGLATKQNRSVLDAEDFPS
ncbi:hypothetical protein ACIPWF_09930 [Paenarthrobacter sp. NPDC089989]|uniref:hypothetical protein n=1 Tax=unclassified Paenarthrobacter TaxID=2634190 RepID=UPI0037F12C00